jgi:3-oxoacyl-[acyl-carrier protein] reductase
VQDVDGTFAAAKPGQAVLDRLAGYHGRLAGRLGQRQPRAQPGRQCRRVGAAGAVGRGDIVPLDPDLGGKSYESFKDEFSDKIIECFARYCPNMTKKNILGRYVYTGREYVQEMINMRGGDIFMGAFNAEQVMYNHFGYRSPIPNLYNAGSAGHPGGAISGGAGYISASVIANDLGLKPWWQPWDARSALELLPQLERGRGMSAALQNVVFPGLTDRVVIITGAGQGIGRVFAKSFAMAGARAVIAELNEKKAAAVSEEIMKAGGQALAVTTDVADPAAIEEMIGLVEDKYGRIDVLINNAGVFSTLEMRPFDQIPLEEWERVLRVNLTGPFLCARAVLPAIRRAKWGRIINVASGAVRLGRPNYLHYIATKGALASMSLSMARELGSDGITVNAILPGATFTEIERKTVTPAQKERIIAMQCVPRAEVPEDLVGAVLFLASEASAFVTGQSINLDGGVTGS